MNKKELTLTDLVNIDQLYGIPLFFLFPVGKIYWSKRDVALRDIQQFASTYNNIIKYLKEQCDITQVCVKMEIRGAINTTIDANKRIGRGYNSKRILSLITRSNLYINKFDIKFNETENTIILDFYDWLTRITYRSEIALSTLLVFDINRLNGGEYYIRLSSVKV